MPYTEKQKKQHILELQKYLHAISLICGKIPLVVPDGIYSPATVSAVKAFQSEYGLNPTGETDSETWDKIVSVYKELFDMKPESYPAFPSEKYICKKGADGTLVYVIQAMLFGMKQSFDNFPEIKVCGHFNDETENVVKVFQGQCGITQNGVVDCITWNMLVSCSCHKI